MELVSAATLGIKCAARRPSAFHLLHMQVDLEPLPRSSSNARAPEVLKGLAETVQPSSSSSSSISSRQAGPVMQREGSMEADGVDDLVVTGGTRPDGGCTVTILFVGFLSVIIKDG